MATEGLMTVYSVDICTTCYHFQELKCKRKVEIISGRRKCNVLRGLVLQAMVKVAILADFPGTREAHFTTGSRPDSRVSGYPSTRCEPYYISSAAHHIQYVSEKVRAARLGRLEWF